jgi:ribosomal protein S18 acetylase RimI-like enzyme
MKHDRPAITSNQSVILMSYQFRFLSQELFPRVHETFREAFADYYVDTSGITESILFNRVIKNGVDFETSVGAFDGERMVAVTIVGRDEWKGAPAAYDIGTGVVPGHRGKGLAGGMFDFALPRLRESGVKRFVLEVIQENEPAIKAYERAGFEIAREFDCFKWPLDTVVSRDLPGSPLEIRTAPRELLDDITRHVEWRPSWENSFSSLRRIPDRLCVYGAYDEGMLAGLLVYYPALNWINTLVVKREYRRRGVATALLVHFAHERPGDRTVVKFVNVDHSDRATLALLEKTGFELHVRQYEMELEL